MNDTPPSSWESVQALATILEPEAFDPNQPAAEGWREATMNVALAHAARAIEAGWRPPDDGSHP